MNIQLFLTGLFIVVFNSSFCPLHPLKISSSEIACMDKKLQVKIKLFADDFGAALSRLSRKQVSFDSTSVDPKTLIVLNQYIHSNFQMSINKKAVKMLFIKSIIEEDEAASTKLVWLFYEVEAINCLKIKTMTVKNTLLFGAVPEQKNISTIKLFQNENVKTLLFENQKEDSVKALNF